MKPKPPASRASLLLVDDDRHILEAMGGWLREQNYEVDTAPSVDTALAALGKRPYDLVLCDVRLGDREGFEVLERCRAKFPDTLVILITGYGSVETAIEAIRAGAFDLLTKPLIDDELEMAIERALNTRHVLEENKNLKAQLDLRFGLENIVGHDPRMRRVYDMIESVADTKASILVTGESGTGKSMLARAIHRRSGRRDKPFVEVACGALPDTLLESELFGHVAGAFTGASADKMGKFKQADTGTIFLDEIGTAPPSLQVKLLRVLQEFDFEQVGGTKTFHVDTRVILATNESLEQLVAAGRFRQDLYYRVNVINVELPSLRDRLSDIPLLAQHFLERVVGESGKKVQGYTSDALDALQRYRWPGNVRELQNVVERAVLLSKSDMIRMEDLPPSVISNMPMAVDTGDAASLKSALQGPERQILIKVLEDHHWNRQATAAALGINRTTLYKKMKRLGLYEPPQLAAR